MLYLLLLLLLLSLPNALLPGDRNSQMTVLSLLHDGSCPCLFAGQAFSCRCRRWLLLGLLSICSINPIQGLREAGHCWDSESRNPFDANKFEFYRS